MNVHNDTSMLNQPLSMPIRMELSKYRLTRNFNPKKYVDDKCHLLRQYFHQHHLKGAIVALSGGVDSSVVYALLHTAFQNTDVKIFPMFMPCTKYDGAKRSQADFLVKNQLEITGLVDELLKIFPSKKNFSAYDNTINVCESSWLMMAGTKWMLTNSLGTSEVDKDKKDWVGGQVPPISRTAYLYTLSNQLAARNIPSVVCGTTNRDEGAYLGFVGKSSDGMVDIQVISDLHKSEVYKVAESLGIPESIMNRAPNGDMYDNRTDEEVFGAPYDFVELYLHALNTPLVMDKLKLSSELGIDGGQFKVFSEALENLHSYNKHKYYGGSPAAHLDLLESGVNGGWPLDFSNRYYSRLLEIGNVIKPCFVSPTNKMPNLEQFDKPSDISIQQHGKTQIYTCDKFFNDKEVEELSKIYNDSDKAQANVYGYLNDDHLELGSKRVSLYDVNLSKLIWDKLQYHFSGVVHGSPELANVDGMWKPVGVNPLFRYIGYDQGASLVPHYDYPFIDKEDCQSLYTLVIYLTDNQPYDGATRFIKDEFDPDHLEDWKYEDIQARHPQYYLNNHPKKGSIALFPHYLLHDCESVATDKLIIRTDIMFKRIRFS